LARAAIAASNKTLTISSSFGLDLAVGARGMRIPILIF
jgi:hypothetical protein